MSVPKPPHGPPPESPQEHLLNTPLWSYIRCKYVRTKTTTPPPPGLPQEHLLNTNFYGRISDVNMSVQNH